MPEIGIAEVTRDKRETPLQLLGSGVKRAAFSPDAAALHFSASKSSTALGVFYQVVEAGFDRTLPEKAITRGLEVYRELVDEKGKAVDHVALGQPVTVKLTARSLANDGITNVALIDSAARRIRDPARFACVGGQGAAGCDYVDLREDRAVFYATIPTTMQTITYQIKATNRGSFRRAAALRGINVRARGERARPGQQDHGGRREMKNDPAFYVLRFLWLSGPSRESGFACRNRRSWTTSAFPGAFSIATATSSG